ncbi:MAG: hypothetical protein AB9895_01415 [Negativicutes bacterium]
MVPSVKTIFPYFTWLMRAKALVEGSSKIGIDSVLICKLERFCPSKKLSDNLRFSGKSLTKMRQVKKSKVPRRPAEEKSFAGYFFKVSVRKVLHHFMAKYDYAKRIYLAKLEY